MAQLPTIQLDWWKHPKGYHLETKPHEGLCVVPNGDPREQPVHCRPLDSSQTLFRTFASTATTPEGVLGFVQRFGPLMCNPFWDRVDDVIHHARRMQDTLKWVAAQPRRRPSDREAYFGPGATLDAWIAWDEDTKGPVLKLRVRRLIDGLWLQFAQAVMRDIQIRACKHCGGLFETGVGTGRRRDAKFCSDEHRIAFNSLKRSKGK